MDETMELAVETTTTESVSVKSGDDLFIAKCINNDECLEKILKEGIASFREDLLTTTVQSKSKKVALVLCETAFIDTIRPTGPWLVKTKDEHEHAPNSVALIFQTKSERKHFAIPQKEILLDESGFGMVTFAPQVQSQTVNKGAILSNSSVIVDKSNDHTVCSTEPGTVVFRSRTRIKVSPNNGFSWIEAVLDEPKCECLIKQHGLELTACHPGLAVNNNNTHRYTCQENIPVLVHNVTEKSISLDIGSPLVRASCKHRDIMYVSQLRKKYEKA